MENTTAQNLPSTSTALYETWRGTLLQYSTVKHVTLLVLGLFMCKELITILYNLFFDPLRDIPGPFWARLSRLWELKMAFSGRMHETLVELHQTHGPVVRVGPNTYSFSQPEDVATIYSASASKTFPKSNFYNTSGDPARPNIFSMTSEKQHTQRKRKLAGLYNMSTMVHYEAAVDAVNSILKQKFSGLAESADAVNLPELMQFYAFDVIGQISVSPASHNTCSYSSVLTCFVHIDRTFGMIEAGRDIDDFVAITKEALLYMGTVGLFAEMHPLFVWWNKLSGGRNAGVALEKLAKKSLEKAGKQGISNEGASRSDPFVSKLIRMHEGGTVGTDDMIDSIGANIAAGSDTTAITLSAAFYHLYRNPDILAKLRAEIDGRPDPISFEESQQMPYLQAVINETLRIHPAVGYLLRRKVPQGGSCLAGRQFPQGAQVGVSAWALHHNASVSGDDYAIFRPERWLEGTQKTTSKSAMSFAFGGGSRICLGKNISLLELNKVIPQVVRDWDITFETGDPWKLFCVWFVWPEYTARIQRRVKTGKEDSGHAGISAI